MDAFIDGEDETRQGIQDRQWTYNVTLRCIGITIVAVEMQSVLHILNVSSLINPAFKVHMLCYHLWPVWLCHALAHYITKNMIFGKMLLNIKCVLTLFATFVWNISHSKKNFGRNYHKCM